MRGSTEFTHYGHPCFVRDDCEAAHSGETELERLEYTLGFLATLMGGNR